MMSKRMESRWSWMVMLFIAMLLLGAGCKSKRDEGTVPPTPPVTNDDPGDPGERRALFTPGEELYARVEGIGAENACASDADCVKTGCSSEVCSAEQIVTTCEMRTWPQEMGAECGCVDGQCVWYR